MGVSRAQRTGIILAGGRSQRMGTDKLSLVIGDSTLLERAVAACSSHCDAIIVAGPRPSHWVNQSPTPVTFIVEDPPFGGPAAGIYAAITHLTDGPDSGADDEILLLAGDLENPGLVVETLTSARMGPEGVILRDIDGWAQYLAGRYRESVLRNIVIANMSVRNVSVRRLLRGTRVDFVDVPRLVTRDIDTPGEAAEAGISFSAAGSNSQ